ncbi:MAG: phospholipase D family protein [Chloroflexi bacterium]|nr:phospholipase D family protein [Chloroflexota bacterium]
MAKFLNTSKAYAEIEEIISKTKSKVVLISPYIKIPELLLARLKYIDKNGIQIVVVCRKDNLKADVISDLKQLKSLELRFDENLHAKCFYNEELMVIGSLNLYDYSQQNNREMGILLSLKDEPNVFNEARQEAEFIVSNAKEDITTRDDSSRTRTTRRTSKPGFCIRCRTPIPYNIDRPLCDEHFEVWAQYGDPNYPEHHCHTCGNRASTSKARPQCNVCYAHSQR